MPAPNLVRVYSSMTLHEAGLLQVAIQARGIEVLLSVDTFYGDGRSPADGPITDLLVPEDCAEEARQAIAEWLSSRGKDRPTTPPWTCPSCGEENDESFEFCWSCGNAPRVESRIMYIELRSGCLGRGPARIGRVRFSKAGETLCYGEKRFQPCKGSGIEGNYFDLDTGKEYWISDCRKNGEDRHWAGSGPVEIDEDVREEYWTEIRGIPERKGDALA